MQRQSGVTYGPYISCNELSIEKMPCDLSGGPGLFDALGKQSLTTLTGNAKKGQFEDEFELG